MTNLLPTIVPKSDQLNADDLIGGTMTIKVTKVALSGDADQPVAIHYEGGDGKPYKPCKSMRRVMIMVWGEDGNAFAGQRMTLYRDDKVTFGKDAVGGIRISHMSGIDREKTMALTTTRGARKPYTVRPLPTDRRAQTNEAARSSGGDQGAANSTASPPETSGATQTSSLSLTERIAAFKGRVAGAQSTQKLTAMWGNSAALRNEIDRADPDEVGTSADLETFWQAAYDRLEQDEREAG